MAHLAFFGTPEFALPTLEGLYAFCKDKGHTLSMVVCQPDKPSHRGKQIHAPPIKEWAAKLGIPVFQPASLKKGSVDGDLFFDAFSSADIDLAVVVAYGRIIPKRFLDLPKCGFVNVHASLLPRWRGAAPIQRAIEAGDTATGVSIMDLIPELDAGDVYQTEQIEIEPTDDGASLAKKLAALGRDVLLECLTDILQGTLAKIPQPAEGVTHAPPIAKQEGEINWNDSAINIANRCRAFQPWPGAFTVYREKLLRLFGPSLPSDIQNIKRALPGTILHAKDFLAIATAAGVITFSEAQVEGKRRMAINELVRGYALIEGDTLGIG